MVEPIMTEAGGVTLRQLPVFGYGDDLERPGRATAAVRRGNRA
jgi:hypothetical protein